MKMLYIQHGTPSDLIASAPLLLEARRAGHEVRLVLPKDLVPLAEMAAPGIVTLPLQVSPFGPGFNLIDRWVTGIADQLEAFAADTWVIASRQWTELEEHFVQRARPERVFAGRGGFWQHPARPVPPVIRVFVDHPIDLDPSVPLAVAMRRLAALLLGEAVELPAPRLAIPADLLEQSRADLASLGIEPGAYAVWCVGMSQSDAWRLWNQETWAEALGAWSSVHDGPVLLVHAPEEADSVAGIRAAAGEAGARAIAIEHGSPEGLVALLAGARIVVANCGPIASIAAAAGAPVVQVGLAGPWRSWIPQAGPCVTLVPGLPTPTRAWSRQPTAAALAVVTPARLAAAARDLLSRSIDQPQIRAVPLDGPMMMAFANEAIGTADRVVEQRDRLAQQHKREQTRNEQLSEAYTAAFARVNAEIERSRELIEQLRSERDRLKASQTEAEAALGDLRRELESTRAEKESMRSQAEAAPQLAERLNAVGADLHKTHVVAGELKNQLEARHARVAELEQKINEFRDKLEAVRQQRNDANAKLAQADVKIAQAEARAARAQAPSQRGAEELIRARGDLVEAHALVESLRGELERARADRESLDILVSSREGEVASLRSALAETEARLREATAAREKLKSRVDHQAAELRTLRLRINELLASRWRKLGQRLRVAMVLPWEREQPGLTTGSGQSQRSIPNGTAPAPQGRVEQEMTRTKA